MAFINSQRLLVGVLFAALVHPACISPAETGDIRGLGRGTRTKLRRISKGVGLVDLAAVLCRNAEFINLSCANAGDEQRPDAAVIELCHGMFLFIPFIEVTDHMDCFGIRRPYGKEKTFFSILFGRMGTKLFINIIVSAISKEVRICL